MSFLFIVLPAIAVIVYEIYNLIVFSELEYLVLIVFIPYLIAAIIVFNHGIDIFKKKFLSILLYIIFPIVILAVLTDQTDEWYEQYFKFKEKTNVYLYNESSAEEIIQVQSKSPVSFKETLIDKYYNACWYSRYFVQKKFYKNKIKTNSVRLIHLRPETYDLQVVSYNPESKKYYVTTFNEDSITIDKNKKDIYLCFGGKNFFQYDEDATDAEKLVSAFTSKGSMDTEHNEPYKKEISLSKDAPRSKKTEVEEYKW